MIAGFCGVVWMRYQALLTRNKRFLCRTNTNTHTHQKRLIATAENRGVRFLFLYDNQPLHEKVWCGLCVQMLPIYSNAAAAAAPWKGVEGSGRFFLLLLFPFFSPVPHGTLIHARRAPTRDSTIVHLRTQNRFADR